MTNLADIFDHALPADEWWAEFRSNACCPDATTAARRLCGCGGSARIPTGISRLLFHNHDEEF